MLLKFLSTIFGLPGGSDGKASVYNARDLVQSLGWEDSLEKEMATPSSSLALKIPWTEKLCAGYYPWGRKKSGTNERLHFHFLHRLLQDIVSAYLFCRANRFACWEGR